MALSIYTKFTEIVRCEKEDYYRTDVKNVFILRNGKKDTLNIVQSKQKILIDILIDNYPNKVIQFNHDDIYDLKFIIPNDDGIPLSYTVYTGKLNGYRFSTDDGFNFVAVEISKDNVISSDNILLNKVLSDIIKTHYDINKDDEYKLYLILEEHEEERKEEINYEK